MNESEFSELEPKRPSAGGHRVVRKSLVALALKVLAAGVTFLMFLVLARAMSPREFGHFSFAFSAASLLGLVACFGQGSLAVRFLPIYRSTRQVDHARKLIRFGYLLVGSFSAVLAAGTLAFAILAPSYSHMIAAGVLLAALALAEFQAGLLRGMGRLTMAMAPRDVLWRVLVIGSVYALWRRDGSKTLEGPGLSATTAVTVVGVTLAVIVLLQLAFVVAPEVRRSYPRAENETGSVEVRPWGRASVGLWLTSVFKVGSDSLCVVLVGLALSPTTAGGVFVAIKIAVLMNFVLVAGNLVASPLIARSWFEGRTEELQRTAARITMLSLGPSVLAFAAVCAAGPTILGFFGQEYRAFHLVLIVLSAGQLINTACGQTGVLLSMTGHERVQLRLIATTSLPFLALIVPAAKEFGALGAASMIAGSMVVWNIRAVIWTRRNLGIDTSFLGLLSVHHRRKVSS